MTNKLRVAMPALLILLVVMLAWAFSDGDNVLRIAGCVVIAFFVGVWYGHDHDNPTRDE